MVMATMIPSAIGNANQIALAPTKKPKEASSKGLSAKGLIYVSAAVRKGLPMA